MKRKIVISVVAVFALLVVFAIWSGGWFNREDTTKKNDTEVSANIDADSLTMMEEKNMEGDDEDIYVDTFENLDYDSIKAYAIANWPELAWKRFESDEKPKRIDFEAWLKMVQAMVGKWKKPDNNLAQKAGLSLLDYFREDDGNIVDFSIAYGRDMEKVEVDSTSFYKPASPHAVLFRMSAYTSSGGEISFHSMADFKDFMEQAEQRGLILFPNGALEICKEKLPPGIHLLKKQDETKGDYHELYRFHVNYDSTLTWQTCTIVTDWYYAMVDIIQ